jgi:hypothetical protein
MMFNSMAIGPEHRCHEFGYIHEARMRQCSGMSPETQQGVPGTLWVAGVVGDLRTLVDHEAAEARPTR